MRCIDVTIVGGGLAGSLAAAMLGRAEISTVVIDPHEKYPFDFRVEKIGNALQLKRLAETGMANTVLQSTTHDGENWVARRGHLLEKMPSHQHGIAYDDLVNAIRAEIRSPVETIYGKVASIATSADRQTITLSNGEIISARLIVLASGLNVGLSRNVGIGRKTLSKCHSISIGFDIIPVGRSTFEFPALTYYSEDPSDRTPYITLFPIGLRMRANLFVYREADDPWLRQMLRDPVSTLNATLPNLVRIIGEFEVADDVRVRPVDIDVSTNYRQAGLVLVGDAFATACPAAGTGTDKVYTDVARLCGVHIPEWLKTKGMGADKIAEYYDDPAKQACDAWSLRKAFSFRRVTIDPGLYWKAQRFARFISDSSKGMIRRLYKRFKTSIRRQTVIRPESRSRNSAQGDKWNFCLTAGTLCLRIRSDHEQTSMPEPHTFKAKVALAAVKGDRTITQLSEQYDVHPHQITTWKAQLESKAPMRSVRAEGPERSKRPST